MESNADSPELVLGYFPNLTDTQRMQFTNLAAIFKDWNSKINCISRKDEDHFYERHVLHSLAIGYFFDFKPGTEIMDVGTGGGFPGIPLAILFPEVEFLLVDSIGKKLKVVSDVAQHLGLHNVSVAHSRVEQIDREFDFVVSRAVTTMEEFCGWVSGKIKKKGVNEIPNGILYLKGGDLTEELNRVRRPTVVTPVSTAFREPFFETKQVVYIQYGK